MHTNSDLDALRLKHPYLLPSFESLETKFKHPEVKQVFHVRFNFLSGSKMRCSTIDSVGKNILLFQYFL